MKTLKVLLVGNPNVGKSALFNGMTGKYVTVSNYPGTTVEVTEGVARYDGLDIQIIDTPGMYSMLPISEEEKVARDYIFFKGADCIVNVIDAKNVERMLPLTFQLIETGIPVVLVLNMSDEAERSGLVIDGDRLSGILGIPVVKTVSIKKIGISDVFHHVVATRSKKPFVVRYDDEIEVAADRLASVFTAQHGVSRRTLAFMALQQDREVLEYLAATEGAAAVTRADELRRDLMERLKSSVDYLCAVRRQLRAASIVTEVVSSARAAQRNAIVDFISVVTVSPWWGYLILCAVLYFGLYKFVGEFGAGVLVDFIESDIFESLLLPGLISHIEEAVPYDAIKELLIRDYGIITLGIKYAVAIILPIVTTFFLFFSVLEDSGYLPRLALLLDRLFKKIGLTGRAVIPMVLGFGCDTMATMVTRTLSTHKERVIATILLSLAVPCSAQLGVMLAVLSHSGALLAVWVMVLVVIFLVVGVLSNKLIKGEKTLFFVEVPPVRIPKITNVVVKTYTRLVWYFKEVIPLFIYASLLIWAGRITGVFDKLVDMIAFFLRFIGLPKDAAVVFLFGFFRRDYGAAGLYDMHKSGVFTNNELLVLAVMLTLFLPCIAQFVMTVKERGLRTGMAIAGFVFVFSIFAGYVLHLLLTVTGVQL